MQKVRIKQWLLLLLRTLALACLAMVFARPTLDSRIASAVGGDGRTSVGVIIDNSPSMGLRNSDGGYLEQSIALGQTIAEKLEAGDELTLFTTSTASASSYTTIATAMAGMEAIEIAPTRRDLSNVIREATAALSRSGNINRELYVISDSQLATFGDTSRVQQSADRITGYSLAVGGDPPDNISVDAVVVNSRIIETGQPVKLAVTIRNHGTADLENYVVSAYLLNDRIAQTTINVSVGATAIAELTITPQSRGWLAGEVRLEDDDFEPDNIRHFAIHVPEVRRILVIGDQSESLTYVRTAINAGRSDGRTLFQVDVVGESQLAAANIADYHVVFLIGMSDLSSGEINIVSQYVENGGGLVVFPGRTASIADYNQLLSELEGGRFEGYVGAENLQQPVTRLDKIEADHPLFEGIFDAGSNAVVEQPDVYFAVDYQPVRGTEQTLMTLGNGKPLLQEIKHGRGSTMFFTILPEPSWSDLPVRGLFVPILYRSIYYLSSSSSSGYPELIAGRDAQVVISNAVDDDVLLRSATGTEFVPEKRTVAGGTQLIVTPEMSSRGTITILDDASVVGIIPVNVDVRESDLRRWTDRQLSEQVSGISGVPIRPLTVRGFSADDLNEVITSARTGVELWRPLLIAGLIFLVIEMLVSRIWAPETVGAGN